MSATSTSPGRNAAICSGEREHPDLAGPDLLADGPALDDHLTPLGQPEAGGGAGGLARLHRLGPGLQDVELAVPAVQAPLDVHRPPIVGLDGQRVPGQCLHLGVRQAESALLGCRHRDELRGPAHLGLAGVDHLGRLGPDAALEDRRATRPQGRLVGVELVRVDRALHHALPQPVRRGDEHRVVEAGLGVHGEHDAGRPEIGADHPLHPGRQCHRLVGEGVVYPVGDGPVVVERGKHLADGPQDSVDAADVEERLLLAGERRVGQVLGGRRRADGEGPLGVVPGQRGVRSPDVGLEVGRERLLQHRRPDPLSDLRQPAYVVGVQPVKLGLDPLGQAGLAQEPAVGLGGGGEPVRHPHPRRGQIRDHLPQRGVLAAHLLEIGQTQVREPTDRRSLLGAGMSGRRGDGVAHDFLRLAACNTH